MYDESFVKKNYSLLWKERVKVFSMDRGKKKRENLKALLLKQKRDGRRM